MRHWRLLLVGLLLIAPLIVLISLGAYHLWYTDHLWLWWPLLGLFVLGYVLAWHWTRHITTPTPTKGDAPSYWTDRDLQAWSKVQAKAQEYQQVQWEDLTQAEHYSSLALDLARQVAAVYHPGVAEPFDPLTMPEVLACIELAAADLNELVQKYVPASHLIRIGDIRRARQVWQWYRHGQNVYWLLAAVLDPLQTAARYAVTRGILTPLFEKARQNLLVWFHTQFILRLGHYLIELYSGRLRSGVASYRRWLSQINPPSSQVVSAHGSPAQVSSQSSPDTPSPLSSSPSEPTEWPPPSPLTVVIAGPRGAGKSRLIEVWSQQSSAAPSAAPSTATRNVDLSAVASASQEVVLAGGQKACLVETPGFGGTPTDVDLAITDLSVADVVLLLTSAVSPGRQAEVAWLQKYRDYFAARPHLGRPPLLVVVTHVDLLPPANEWHPPYDWQNGHDKKSAVIRDCLRFVAEQLGVDADSVVPVGLHPDRPWGVWEELLPAILTRLPAARNVAGLRNLHTEITAGRWQKLGQQFRHLLDATWHKISQEWQPPQKN
ncbi:MAG: GTPase [Thermogemmata sp.]|nr:GTPase [Thermogemmata sp.]